MVEQPSRGVERDRWDGLIKFLQGTRVFTGDNGRWKIVYRETQTRVTVLNLNMNLWKESSGLVGTSEVRHLGGKGSGI